MQETKVWYRSKTIIGIIVMVAGFVIHKFFPDASVGETEIGETVAVLLESIGSILAFVGRLKANTAVAATK